MEDDPSTCKIIALLLHLGMMLPTALPSAGQVAPSIHGQACRRSFGAEGRAPRFAQPRGNWTALIIRRSPDENLITAQVRAW
jgi:hypothetical protein